MTAQSARFDAPFWLFLAAGVLFLGAFGFIGLAAAAQDASPSDTAVVSVDDS